MTLIMTFEIEDDLGSSLFISEMDSGVQNYTESGITLLSGHISSKVIFSPVSDMLILC